MTCRNCNENFSLTSLGTLLSFTANKLGPSMAFLLATSPRIRTRELGSHCTNKRSTSHVRERGTRFRGHITRNFTTLTARRPRHVGIISASNSGLRYTRIVHALTRQTRRYDRREGRRGREDPLNTMLINTQPHSPGTTTRHYLMKRWYWCHGWGEVYYALERSGSYHVPVLSSTVHITRP